MWTDIAKEFGVDKVPEYGSGKPDSDYGQFSKMVREMGMEHGFGKTYSAGAFIANMLVRRLLAAGCEAVDFTELHEGVEAWGWFRWPEIAVETC